MKRAAAALVAGALWLVAGGRAAAQGASDACLAHPAAEPQPGCYLAAQAIASAYPQTGVLVSGGNPVPGVESTRGITLGIVPKTTATLRIEGAWISLPELEGRSGDTRSALATAFRASTATRLFEGISAGPVGGLGAIDLLLDGALLPSSGESHRATAAFGVGARIGIVRETFGTPGVALSAAYHHAGRQEIGGRCGPAAPCPLGAAATAAYSLNDVGARLTVGKRVGPVGLLGGAGWDRFSTSNASFQYPLGGTDASFGVADVRLHDSRWSLFGNVSYALIVGSLVAEGGWSGGGGAVRGYERAGSGFDPGKGTPFGSVSLRVSL